jgi:hypothetical protein
LRLTREVEMLLYLSWPQNGCGGPLSSILRPVDWASARRLFKREGLEVVVLHRLALALFQLPTLAPLFVLLSSSPASSSTPIVPKVKEG